MYKNPYQTFCKFSNDSIENIPIGEPLLLLVNGRQERVNIELVPATFDGKHFISSVNQGTVHESLILFLGKEIK